MKSNEIKFKVWDNVDYMSNPFTLEDVMLGKTQFTSDCVVRPFTGYKDKHGNEIYDGDILGNGILPKVVRYKEEVITQYGHGDSNTTIYLGYRFGNWGNHKDAILDNLEVIGNIYQNRNLTNGKDED